jgi:hypothetical protein
MTTNDPVSHPAHYTQYPVEVIELTEHMNFCRGNAVKYIARAGAKNPDTEVEDLQKAVWYLEREIARLASAKVREDSEPEELSHKLFAPPKAVYSTEQVKDVWGIVSTAKPGAWVPFGPTRSSAARAKHAAAGMNDGTWEDDYDWTEYGAY